MATDRVAELADVEGLKTSRTYGPGCAKLGQKVIIAGGNNGETFRSTEVLDLDSREIIAGGDMAKPRRWFHLATIRRGGQEKVFAVAGFDEYEYLNTVEEWVEENSTWSLQWRKVDLLAERQGSFGAVAVLKEFICPA